MAPPVFAAESSVRTAAMRFQRAAARGLVEAARLTRQDLQVAVNDTVRSLRALHEAGADPSRLYDALGLIHDAATNRDAALRKEIDEHAGAWEHPVDLTELEQLITAME